ncbi:hypothetical protein HMPREF9373_2462 [Psychrobacter sp. 1501(2011)]|nr:hypothetical protein HMPREF9373_2462 [Psychrobacter sp. 1501(2011)]
MKFATQIFVILKFLAVNFITVTKITANNGHKYQITVSLNIL